MDCVDCRLLAVDPRPNGVRPWPPANSGDRTGSPRLPESARHPGSSLGPTRLTSGDARLRATGGRAWAFLDPSTVRLLRRYLRGVWPEAYRSLSTPGPPQSTHAHRWHCRECAPAAAHHLTCTLLARHVPQSGTPTGPAPALQSRLSMTPQSLISSSEDMTLRRAARS
ncbi:hypothetical protein BO71DRAFT_82560 [Aspergillus ellipticus CBS 707.79]|uniref:Uncharacterized protein n=1 Tax=Aspergillus ellipticus CBS 707.79 TaxID=1448320 RepID=A0A319CY21_9EURO|nr:hypothetical protein BO71DRAFT_82560 [Aspergillus ellipticus CBS 707.79]